MTLIALLAPHSYPFLVGDLIVSQPSKFSGPRPLSLPISGPLPAFSVPYHPTYVISHLQQKLHAISRNIVIAWAGSAVAARCIAHDLQVMARRRPDLSANDMLAFLRSAPYREVNDVSILGIVYEPAAHRSSIFTWRANIFVSKRLGTIFHVGLGSKDLLEIVEDFDAASSRSLNDVVPENIHEAIASVLSLAHTLNGFEILGGLKNLNSLYGGAIQVASPILRLPTSRPSDTTAMFWFYNQEDMYLNWTGFVFKTKMIGDLLYIRRLVMRHDRMENEIQIIPPITAYGPPKVKKRYISLASNYLCHVMIGFANGKITDFRTRVDHKNDPKEHEILFWDGRTKKVLETTMELTERWHYSTQRSGFRGVALPFRLPRVQ